MAADLNSSNEGEPIGGINVTPFVDVVLVLLVIFMITAPMIARESLNIQLPKAESGDGKTAPETLGVAITKQGQLLLNGVVTTEDGLKTAAEEALKKNASTSAVISADQETKHGDVVRAIDLIKSAGIVKFAIQIERKE